MKKICFLFLTALFSTVTMAQDAKSVLDKAEGYRLVRRQDHVDLYEGQRGSECQQSH